MKKTIILFLILVPYIINSQEYFYTPLVKENTQWNMYDVQGGGQCYDEHIDTLLKKYTIIGDTVINNVTYKKFCKIDPATLIPKGIGGIREENRKVYYAGDTYANKYGENIRECLLYDFTVQAGDVVSFNLDYPWLSYTVTDVDYIPINGSLRKRYKFETLYGAEYIVEGIGNITTGILHLITPIPTCSGYHQEFKLICFSENGYPVYKNPEFTDCNSLKQINAGTNDKKESKFSITPNPAKDYIKISMKENVTGNIRLNIINNTGKIVYKQTLNTNERIIQLGFLSKGIYLVQIETDNANESYKIVKQ
jgi:hypothetical protein